MQIQRLNKNDTEEVDKVEWIIANMAELNICMELINAELYDTLGAVVNTIFYTTNHYSKAGKYLEQFKVIVGDVYKEMQETNDELIYNLIVNVVNRKTNMNSYLLAKHVIESNIDILSGPIDTFVHSIFTSRTDPTDELSEETYSLMFELYRIHPDLVLKSVTLLSDEMNSQVTDRRSKSCMLVGKIASQTDNIILKDFPALMTE
jgi:hypothetical protein